MPTFQMLPGETTLLEIRIASTIQSSTLHRRYYRLATLPLLLGLVVIFNLVLLLWMLLHQRSGSSQSVESKRIIEQSDNLQKVLTQQFSAATADIASRLEQTKGDLRQQVTDRLADGFSGLRTVVESQMKAGRQEQSERLAETRTELAGALAITTSALKSEFDRLNQQTAESLESIRERVDAKLMAITEQVQQQKGKYGAVKVPPHHSSSSSGSSSSASAAPPDKKKHWIEINKLLVPFGKHVCTGKLPKCSTCPVVDMCRQRGVTSHR